MCKTWKGLAALAVTLLALVGCASSEPQVRPIKVAEAFRAPPDDDPRFSQPPQYPANTLNRDQLLLRGTMNANAKGPGGPGGMGNSNGAMGATTGLRGAAQAANPTGY